MTSVEIFSGAGGLALGIEMAGFRHLALVEYDPDACDTLEENSRRRAVVGHDWPVFRNDVRDFDYRPYVGQTSLLAGGAPCQPFSLGGRQRGDRDRRNMFPEVFRALRELMPDAILLENVRNLAGRSFLPYFEYIVLQLRYPFVVAHDDEPWTDHKARLQRLERERPIGEHDPRHTYQVAHRVVNAADYGVPQIRHRVFIIGYRRDLNVWPTFPGGEHSEDALLWAQWVDGTYWDEHRVPKNQRPAMPPNVAPQVRRFRSEGKPPDERWRTLRDAINQTLELPEPTIYEHPSFQKHYLVPGARVYDGHTGNDLDRPAKTIKAGDHGNPGGEHVLVRDGMAHRYLSIRECARVQTFPDAYHFLGSRTECMRQLGNAVPVELARQLATAVRTKLPAVAGKARYAALPCGHP
ncbi:MAG: DNA cytosine methyltransferase [Chloroflexia bacterium]|nr:DNA cytosine methyltransferase [Chloroflexia bacterium]